MLLSWVQNFRNSVPQFATPGPQSGTPGQVIFSNNEKLVTLATSVAPTYFGHGPPLKSNFLALIT